MTNIKHVNSVVDRDFRNRINQLIDVVNSVGISIDELVVKGMMSTEQYSQLITAINGLVKIGEINLDTLSGELKSEIEKINNKIDKGNISVADINKNLGKIDQTFLTEELLQQITGNASVNAVPANNSLTTEKYVNESVTKAKRTVGGEFATVIFKGEIPNLNLKSGERGIELKSDFRVFDSKQSVDISGNKKVNFAAGDNSLLLINVKTHEMRCINGMYTHLISDDEVVMMNIQFTSPSQLAIQQARATFDYTINGEPSIKAQTIGNRELKKGAVSIANTNFIEVPNYFNKNDVEVGKSVTSTTGEISSIANQNLSNKIKITGEVDLYLQYISVIVCYDENDNYLTGWVPNSTSTKYKTHKNTDYIRLSVRNDRVDIAMVYEGSTEKPYEPYNVKILGSNLINYPNKRIQFSPEQINAEFIAPDYDYQQMTLTEYYAAFEQLAEENPDVLSYRLLGKDATGEYDVFEYRWKPPTYMYENARISKPKPKIMFVSNIHGFEKPSAYSTYYMIKAMCENWRDNPSIEYLRNNVEIIFIPIANPYGFVNNTYKNGREVNIQVNFPVYWRLTDKTSTVYGGTEPLSEPESQHIKKMLDDNSDALFFIDLHASTGNGFYSLSPSERGYSEIVEESMNYAVEKLTRELKKNYPLITEEGMLGWYQLRPGNGTLDTYVSDRGLPASVFELFYSLEYSQQYSNDSMKAGTEMLADYLLTKLLVFKERM